MGRGQIWAAMQAVCKTAKVAPSKVFPHNLRHLFARTFYKSCRDVVNRDFDIVVGHRNEDTCPLCGLKTERESISQKHLKVKAVFLRQDCIYYR